MVEAQTDHSKNLFRDGLKAIWRHAQPFKNKLAIMAALGVISSIANGFVPYVTGRFFDALIGLSQHQPVVSTLWPLWLLLLLAWVIVELVANNIDWIMDRIRRKVSTGIQFKIQTDGFTHMFHLPLSYHKNAHTNGELQKISQASWRVSAILDTAGNIIPQFLGIFIGIVLAATISMLMASVLLLGVLIYVVLLIRILRPVATIDAAVHKSWNESWDDSAASIQQIESVKQASAEDYEVNKVTTNLWEKTQELCLRLERNWSDVNFIQRTVVFLTQLTIFILAIHLVANGSITVGELVALNGYALMFFGPVAALGNSWQTIQNGMIVAANVETIFEKKEEVYVPENAIVPQRFLGEVSFKDVFFRYDPDQPEVLKDISFTAKPGYSVALVGESGVGKSTAISLISGYHFPEKGSVTIDGIDTRKLDLNALRRHIAVVPQEVALFNDTIKANIRYGTFDATDEDILKVAEEAHITDFVAALPQGYETLVGERGIKLSVGQKQRIAIARAMLRSPAILILDEPTSALDAVTEKIVTESLERLMKDRTTFIIAHRLSTVRRSNMIMVFDKGRIVEAGSHQELIDKDKGIYRRLYEYQIGLH
jgi:ABC-type multidrug transport system fused ATPase/permease subunit